MEGPLNIRMNHQVIKSYPHDLVISLVFVVGKRLSEFSNLIRISVTESGVR